MVELRLRLSCLKIEIRGFDFGIGRAARRRQGALQRARVRDGLRNLALIVRKKRKLHGKLPSRSGLISAGVRAGARVVEVGAKLNAEIRDALRFEQGLAASLDLFFLTDARNLRVRGPGSLTQFVERG